jgi:anti-anti-sigma factor
LLIQIEESLGVVIVRVSGDINFENWNEVSKSLEGVVQQGTKDLILNWAGVISLDTSGLQTLVGLIKASRNNPDFKFSLVTDNPDHVNLISLVGFNKLIPIFPSEEEALKAQQANQAGEH